MDDLLEMRGPSQYLARAELFRGLSADVLDAFAQDATWVHLERGEVLFKQGDAPDALFVVVNGSLEVLVRARPSELPRLVEELGSGAVVGEMAVLTDMPRSATLRARRDTELVRVSHESFLQVMERYPRLGVGLARLLVQRLRETTATGGRLTRHVRTVALLPLQGVSLPAGFGQRIADALARPGQPTLHITREMAQAAAGVSLAMAGADDAYPQRLLPWLSEQEVHYRYLVYACDPDLTTWTTRALHSADLALLVAYADGPSAVGPIEAMISGAARAGAGPRCELVLLQEGGVNQPTATRAWLDARADLPLAAWRHIRVETDEDIRRLARTIAGEAVGVVLGGGGARGLAHIGALQAIRESGLPIDAIGGTSMGSVLAGQYALGYDTRTMVEASRRAFCRHEGLRDYTVPVVALHQARLLVNKLRAMFGETRIEDLWIPYFCVSSNLSRAQVVVHDQGPLWLWTRASCSIPGLAPPITRAGDLLVDGGLLNNVPADVMRERGGGTVLAVDVGAAVDLLTDPARPTEAVMSGWPHLWRLLDRRRQPEEAAFPNIIQILNRTALLGSVRDGERMRAFADLYMDLPVERFGMTEFRAMDRLVEIGYRYAAKRITAWQRNQTTT